MKQYFFYIFSLIYFANGIIPGYLQKEESPVFNNFKLTIDANWRWLHFKDQYSNCYENEWKCNSTECDECVLEGISLEQYKNTYGVEVINNSILLKFKTGSNIGSRLYLLENNKYWQPNLLNKQISIDVDISNVPCAINSAVYLVEMKSSELDYLGIGYADAQCPTDIKYLDDGTVNLNKEQKCANEIDLIEANNAAMAWTLHPCLNNSCDKSGADANSYRQGNKLFYGIDKIVNTKYPFSVITQFIGNPLTEVKRFYKQNNTIIEHPYGSLNSSSIKYWKNLQQEPNVFEETGGFQSLTDSLNRGMSLVVSIWDDSLTNMRWLDSGDRGPCTGNDQPRNQFPDASVIFSNIIVEDLTY